MEDWARPARARIIISGNPHRRHDDYGTERALVIAGNTVQTFESDSQVRELASAIGLHNGFGPAPSIEMLLQETASLVNEAHKFLPMKGSVMQPSWNFRLIPGI